jgi:hypothetical protein
VDGFRNSRQKCCIGAPYLFCRQIIQLFSHTTVFAPCSFRKPIPAGHPIAAGTVVILDPERKNTVIPSTESYDTRVAGVVSSTPGIVLGEAGEGKVKVATTGRVKVRADASRGPIRTGDLLVSSDRQGIAMRSEPIDLGGRKIHQPGTLIGKALEPLSEGEGEILVLLSLQ